MFTCTGRMAAFIWSVVIVLIQAGGISGGGFTACDPDTEYTCANKNCISLERVNNTINDCVDNSDEAPVPCKSPLFSCTNNRCAYMDWVLDGNNDCLDGSDEAKLIGTSCVTAVTCCFCDVYVPHSACIDTVCQCLRGYYANDLRNQCIPRGVGGQCSNDEDCSAINNGHCNSESYCACYEGHQSVLDGLLCIPRKLGDRCLVHNDCQPTINHSRCDPVDLTCSCDHDNGFYQQPTGTCEQLVIEEIIDCTSAKDCSSVDADSPAVTCIDHSCQCSYGHVEVNGGYDVIKKNDGFLVHQRRWNGCRLRRLYDECDNVTSSECHDVIPNSRCDSIMGSCVCLNGFTPGSTNSTCVRLGATCRPHLSFDECADVIPGSYCNVSRKSCACRIGHATMVSDVDDNVTLCVRRPIGGMCHVTSDCTVPKSHCASDNRCECDLGWYAINIDDETRVNCVRRQLGDTGCSMSSDCDAVISNSECKSESCVCLFGFRKVSPYKCIRRLLDDNEPFCSKHSNCTDLFANSVCSNTGLCQCLSGFRAIDNNTSCQRRRRLVQGDDDVTILEPACRDDSDCSDAIAKSVCTNSSRQCTCDTGYYVMSSIDGTDTCQRRLLGDKCLNNDDCGLLVRAVCASGDGRSRVCACGEGYGITKDRTECRRRRIGEDDEVIGCTSNGECSDSVEYSVCRLGQCSCWVGYMATSSGYNCKQRVLGDTCINNDDCHEVIRHSECVNSYVGDDVSNTSSGSRCECQQGFRMVNDTSEPPYCQPYVLSDDCNNDADCAMAVQFSRCINRTCLCISGHQPSVAVIGNYNSNISGNASTEIICVRPVFVESTECTSVKDCSNIDDNSDAGVTCLDRLCRCSYGHIRLEGDYDLIKKIDGSLVYQRRWNGCRLRRLYDECDNVTSSECHDVIPNSRCDSIIGSCVCLNGFTPGSTNSTCVRLGATCRPHSSFDECADVIPGSYCNVSRKSCACRIGHATMVSDVDDNVTLCVRRPIGGMCHVTSDCTVPKSHCASDNRCECDLGWYAINIDDETRVNCVRRQLGDTGCSKSSDCDAVISNSECKSETCVCLFGFRKVSPYKCIRRLLDDNEPFCSKHSNCTDLFANSVCSNTGLCQCLSGFRAIDNNTSCQRRRRLVQGDDDVTVLEPACRDDSDCSDAIAKSVCTNSSRQCTCDTGYYVMSGIDGTDTCQRRLLGDKCLNNDDCGLLVRAVCASGDGRSRVCACGEGYGITKDRTECRRRRIGEDDEVIGCTSNGECSDSVEYSVCRLGQCSCWVGYMATSSGYNCKLRVLGDTCTGDADCQAAIRHTVCADSDVIDDDVNNTSTNGLCDCQQGFRIVNDTLAPPYCRPYTVGDNCYQDASCAISVPFSRCIKHTCLCISGYQPVAQNGSSNTSSPDTLCVKRVIGDQCTIDSDCSDAVTFSECDVTKYSCRCDEEHLPAENGTVCAIRPTLAPFIPAVTPDWIRCTSSDSVTSSTSLMFSGVTVSDDARDTHRYCSDLTSNEMCVHPADETATSSDGFCLCRGGYARRWPHEPCRRVKAMEVQLNCSMIARRFELMPLDGNVTNQHWKIYADRLQYNGAPAFSSATETASVCIYSIYSIYSIKLCGYYTPQFSLQVPSPMQRAILNLTIDVIMDESNVTRELYVSNTLLSLADAQPGLLAVFTIYFDFNSSFAEIDIEHVLQNYFNCSEGEIGSSRIYVSYSSNNVSGWKVSDIDECLTSRGTSVLNDCDETATCGNLDGYFYCVCNLDFDDNSTEEEFPGRICIARDKEKVMEAMEQTIRSAGCSDGVCKTPWDVVLVITSSVFSVLLLLLTIELIWRTRQLRRQVKKKMRRKAGLLDENEKVETTKKSKPKTRLKSRPAHELDSKGRYVALEMANISTEPDILLTHKPDMRRHLVTSSGNASVDLTRTVKCDQEEKMT